MNQIFVKNSKKKKKEVLNEGAKNIPAANVVSPEDKVRIVKCIIKIEA